MKLEYNELKSKKQPGEAAQLIILQRHNARLCSSEQGLRSLAWRRAKQTHSRDIMMEDSDESLRIPLPTYLRR